MIIDNETLRDICINKLKLTQPTYGDINSAAISETTCSLRFSCKFNSDFRKLAFNLIPFQRLHFLMIRIDPHTSRDSQLQRFQARKTFNCISHPKRKSSSNFVEQIPNYIKYSICDILQKGLKSAATLCGNSKSIQEISRESMINQQLCLEERHSQISTKMKGMDEMELVDAESE
ncbi:unnamed protein product [Paramecium pentaurelia]|uniref:Uncharacterized protein n=1 Tax=Paramecium pentaurelia TaxID=43138 RepID=A0A8S1ULV3_9CILI|nr:unnamed protein product [Paramecium pentaurelia]